MLFLKPVNISSVTRCKYLVIAALATFWASFFAFFMAPFWLSAFLLCAHIVLLYLLVSHSYRLLVYLFLTKAGEGAVPAAANCAAAPAPAPQKEGVLESGTPPIT